MSSPNRVYRSGNHTVATACSAAVFSAPFEGVTAEYVLTQQYQIDEDYYVPLALDTPYAISPSPLFDYKLAFEGNKQSKGGGIVEWTRIYIKLPTDYEDVRGTFAFTFPGFSGVLPGGGSVGNGGSAVARRPLNQTVPKKVLRQFYITSTPATSIIISQKFQPYYQFPTQYFEYVGDANAAYVATTPSRTAYDALIAAGTYIVAEATTWSRWMGNFYIAETTYVKAK